MTVPSFSLGPPPDPKDPRFYNWISLLWKYVTSGLSALVNLATGITGILGVSHGGTGADLSATGGTSRVLRQSSAGGVVTVGQLATTDITGLGTGVATALGVNVGTDGAFVVKGGALGTPSSGNLSNCTNVPAPVYMLSFAAAHG